MSLFSALLSKMDLDVIGYLGDVITYAPSVGSPVSVPGIFDASYIRVDAGVAGVSAAGPAVFFRLVDLPSDPETDTPTITYSSTAYVIRECRKDGQGGVLLLLHEAT